VVGGFVSMISDILQTLGIMAIMMVPILISVIIVSLQEYNKKEKD
jgi:hypothetical protein